MENIFGDVIRPHLIESGTSGEDIQDLRKMYERIAFDEGMFFELEKLMNVAYMAGLSRNEENKDA